MNRLKQTIHSVHKCGPVLALLLISFSVVSKEGHAQDVFSFQDSIQITTLQDSFCACVNRHAGEKSKDWGDAIALSLFTKLDANTSPYRNSELLLRTNNPAASMRKMDRALDSLIVERGFVKCVPLWSVILKDKAGFFKRIEEMKHHPPLIQYQIVHLRERTGQNLLNNLMNGLSDTIQILFDRKSTFDSVAIQLQKVSDQLKGQVITMEMKFEKWGKDSCGIGKMKLLKNGIIPLGGFRILFSRGDTYAKIERMDMLLRESFKKEDLISAPDFNDLPASPQKADTPK